MPIYPPAQATKVIAAIQRGEVAAIPTDTVYGLVARADDPDAVRRLADLKGRDPGKPLQLLIDAPERVSRWLVAPSALDAVQEFWPGGLTAVVAVSPDCPLAVVTHRGTLGIRQPADPLTLLVLTACGGMLAASSANPAGATPATTAAAIARVFGTAIAILDGGERGGEGSTVVDLTVDPPRVLRCGPVSAEALAGALHREVALDREVAG